MSIIPKVKYQRLNNEKIYINNINCINFVGFNNEILLKKHFERLIVLVPNQSQKRLSNSVTISFSKTNIPKEAYRITILPNEVNINAGSDAGAFYAIQTIKRLINEGTLPLGEIYDEPDLEIRGVMLDISRDKVAKVSTIKEIIDMLASLKYNHLELYVEGFSFEYKSFPQVLTEGNYLTLNEYLELEQYAIEQYIDFVPNQNGFGHMTKWLNLDEYKNLKMVTEPFSIWGSLRDSSTLDPTNIESFNLVKKMYGDMLPYTKSKYFNMNFDEPFELGYGKTSEICKKYGKEHVYVAYFNKLADVVKNYDKTPMLWADVLINCPEAIKQINNAIFIDWGYNLNYPFNSNLKRLKDCGAKFLAAAATSTWGVVTCRYQDMLWSIKNAATHTIKNQGLGLLVTDWGDIGHLQYLPFSYLGFIYASMCAWNNEQAYECDLLEELSRTVNSLELANIIIDLSRYTRHEGEYRSYGSRLFSPILFCEHLKYIDDIGSYFTSKMQYNLLNENQINALESEFNEIQNRISFVKGDELVISEVKNSLLLLQVLLDIQKYLKNKKNCLYDSMIEKFNLYLENHHLLWDKRNNPNGYLLSASRIYKLMDVLKVIKKEAKNYD